MWIINFLSGGGAREKLMKHRRGNDFLTKRGGCATIQTYINAARPHPTPYLSEKARINHQIRAKELRIIGSDGKNHGVLSLEDALRLAEAEGLDLIEISPNSNPPTAKLMDFGKYQYEQAKHEKRIRAGATGGGMKSVQVKIGTGEHDLALKARNASKWLREGHRVKLDLFLSGRAKYMEENFLKERLNRILHLVSEDYKVTENYKRGPKGITIVIERAKN